jgi:hypothetical protein
MTHMRDFRGTDAWETTTGEPVSSFILDTGEVFGCQFFHLVSACYTPARAATTA